MRMRYFKLAAPSLKIHSPYNHFKNSNKEYDGEYTKDLGYGGYWQMMFSCKREDSDWLEGYGHPDHVGNFVYLF